MRAWVGYSHCLDLLMPEPVGIDDASIDSIYAYVLTLYDRYDLAADIGRGPV
jgi:hypothetical protein